MTTKIAREFEVRYAECDGFGHMKSATYLTYVHEATLAALKDMEVDFAKQATNGLSLQAKEVFIDFRLPFTYGDNVTVAAQLVHASPDQLSWEYSLLNAGSTAPHAQIKISYGLFNLTTGKWEGLPNLLSAGLKPPDSPTESYSPIEYPNFPIAPPGAIQKGKRVAWRDATPHQTLDLAAYLEYILEVTNQAGMACGWTFERVSEAGFASVVRRQWIQINQPAVYNTELLLSTWLSPFKSASVTRHVAFQDGYGAGSLAHAHTLWVAVDMDSGRPLRLPEAWKKDFAAQVAVE